MELRILGHELPDTVLSALVPLLNYARIRVKEVAYDAESQTLGFPARRYPTKRRSLLRWAGHAKHPVSCHVTFRNVTECHIEDLGVCDEIIVLFGFKYDGEEIYFCSGEEASGVTCFEVRCRVTGFDFEIRDI